MCFSCHFVYFTVTCNCYMYNVHVLLTRDLVKWLASSDTMESEGREDEAMLNNILKNKNKKIQKIPLFVLPTTKAIHDTVVN
jgi:hypothetical protein